MDYIELKKGLKEPLNRHKYYDSMEKLSDAAIALDNYPNVVYIDFDNLDQNKGREERIINGIINEYHSSLIVKTNRGMHLYYKTNRHLKQWTAGFLNIGVQCDGKQGNALAVVKQNGIVREHQGDFTFDNLTVLPDILLPMYCGKDINNLCGLKDGDGRHNKLLRHLCQIRKNYNDVNIEGVAKFINKYVFDDPMDESELMNVVESASNYDIEALDQTSSTNNSKNKAKIIAICKDLVEKYDIHIADNQLYFLFNNRYINDDKKLMEIIYDIYEFSKNEYDEITFQLKLLALPEQHEKSILALRNGALVDGVFDKECKEFSSSYIDINYNENAYDSEVDSFLQFVSNNDDSSEKNDLRIVIEEMIGHCLMTKNFPHKVFLLVGMGANGKSTLMNILFSMFGDLATNVPIKKLERDDYVARLTNKLVNISDDVDYNYIRSSQNIKTLASGDIVTARELYGKAYYFKNKATMIFSMNELITFQDHTYGMERRLCILPFENKVTKPDPSILDRLTSDNAKSYLLRLGLEGINRIKKNNGQLSESRIINDVVNNYMNENDSVYSFLEQRGSTIVGRQYSIVYDEYKSYCSYNDFKPYKKQNFSRKLKTRGFSTIVKHLNGYSFREIVKDEE